MISKPACEYNEMEEQAYHYALGQEYDELMQWSAFTSVKWTILKIMDDMGFELTHPMFCFIRKIER